MTDKVEPVSHERKAMTPSEQLEACARFMGYSTDHGAAYDAEFGWRCRCTANNRYGWFTPLTSDTDSAALRRKGRIGLEYGYYRVAAYGLHDESMERIVAIENYADHANDIGAAERAAVVGCVCKIVGGE